jgi:hypothetical protein
MKKLLIGSFVGALILFIWQFLSWTTLNIHESNFQYSENQEAILESLSSSLKPGTYYMPTVPPDASEEVYKQAMIDSEGKPWAVVQYHDSLEFNMGMNMFRGFAINFVTLMLLCWVLLKITPTSFSTILITTLSIGFIGFFNNEYIDSIWFDTNVMPDFFDTIIQWGICGAWLGWWLNRE